MTNPELWGDLASRYSTTVPRKLLALDGGGIRGMLTLQILKAIETQLGVTRLCDYFDYIAGTSTGAIIASGLAIGKTVDQLIAFYEKTGEAMFQPARYVERLRHSFDSAPLEQQLKDVFGVDTDLNPPRGRTDDDGGPPRLHTLLLVIMRNVTTDSAWPVSSNPEARYNLRSREDCNLCMPLWQVVRASTAAPTYFQPEIIRVHKTDPTKHFVFEDGGITPYNNPAFALYRFATHPAYHLNWPTGERHLQLVSVGTGAGASEGATVANPSKNMLLTGLGLPTTLMYGSLVDQDINCRTVGRCTYGDVIDRELLDMVPRVPPDEGDLDARLARPVVPTELDLNRQFLYTRYNVDLTAKGLEKLGFGGVDPAEARQMDKADADHIDLLRRIGAAAAKQVDVKAHFGPFATAL